MAAHITQAIAARGAALRMPISALVGYGIMAFADWRCPNSACPYEVPAGLLAWIARAPYLVRAISRESSTAIWIAIALEGSQTCDR
jgi:ferric hydroxamate transport system permease protein